MPMYDYKLLLCETTVLGDAGDEYSGDSVDFGITLPKVSDSNQFGLHIVVTTTLTQTSLNSGAIVWIVHGGSTAPTTKHVGRFFAREELIAGKHYFIPCAPSILRFARGLFDVVTENAVAGAYTMYFGPGPAGGK